MMTEWILIACLLIVFILHIVHVNNTNKETEKLVQSLFITTGVCVPSYLHALENRGIPDAPRMVKEFQQAQILLLKYGLEVPEELFTIAKEAQDEAKNFKVQDTRQSL